MIKKEINQFKKRLDPIIISSLKNFHDDNFASLITHQIKTGGKRLRPFLFVKTFKCLGGKKNSLKVASAIEIFHNYSLLLDDIIDQGALRRGEPTSWEKYGTSATLCVSSFYFSAILNLLKEQNSKAIEIFSKETNNVMEGELIDLLQERTLEIEVSKKLKNKYREVSYDSYLDMISKKTASLFRLSCGLGAILAEAGDEITKKAVNFGHNLGISYQIRDDILDIFGDQNKFGKEIGKDIKERKGGNIVLLLAAKENKDVLKIFKNDKIGDKEVTEAIKMIKQTEAKNKAEKIALEYISKAENTLKKFPKNQNQESLIELLRYIKKRTK
ncbi:MAG: polyprenyl synthetase family protein [Patescibacteria group bacterium]